MEKVPVGGMIYTVTWELAPLNQWGFAVKDFQPCSGFQAEVKARAILLSPWTHLAPKLKKKIEFPFSASALIIIIMHLFPFCFCTEAQTRTIMSNHLAMLCYVWCKNSALFTLLGDEYCIIMRIIMWNIPVCYWLYCVWNHSNRHTSN